MKPSRSAPRGCSQPTTVRLPIGGRSPETIGCSHLASDRRPAYRQQPQLLAPLEFQQLKMQNLKASKNCKNWYF